MQRAVLDLYEPLRPHTSAGGARVRLGSFGATYESAVAELEGFARPLFGIVPLTVGGGDFPHWDRVVAGLEAGTDPGSAEYWGPITRDVDQRMVEQGAVGLALAFCPEQAWEPLGSKARQRLAAWLQGIFEHEPAKSNWQFFRALVALGLERVGVGFDRRALTNSLDRLERYRRGEHWYVDGRRGEVDYYVAFAFHTYGLYYAAANDLGLGDGARAESYRERAASFASDFQHWFAPDGAGIPMGRSLTYRFAMVSFWGALAWADVESSLSWGSVRGLSMRHLRWWADKPISDRDGVLSLGYAYDNRGLCESYNSPSSPYWCTKAFASLAAAAAHPFWTQGEEELPRLDAPLTLPEAGWVVARDDHQAIALVARRAPDLDSPEQAAAKYRKFAYSSVFGFSGEVRDGLGAVHTDSMLALTDMATPPRVAGVRELSERVASLLISAGADGRRRVRLGSERAGVENGMAWSTWRPWPDVRVDSVCVAIDGAWHLRLHRVRTGRPLHAVETGFALGYTAVSARLDPGISVTGANAATVRTEHGCAAIAGLSGNREGAVRALAVNANLMHPHVAVPALCCDLEIGDHRLACAVFAHPLVRLVEPPPPVPPAAEALLERIGEDGT